MRRSLDFNFSGFHYVQHRLFRAEKRGFLYFLHIFLKNGIFVVFLTFFVQNRRVLNGFEFEISFLCIYSLRGKKELIIAEVYIFLLEVILTSVGSRELQSKGIFLQKICAVRFTKHMNGFLRVRRTLNIQVHLLFINN